MRKRALAGDEGGAAGGAGLLGVEVGEDRAFVGDAVDVGRAVAHHAAVVGADVPVADVVAQDDEDVRLLGLGLAPPAAPMSASVAKAEAATQFFKLNVILLPAEMFNSTGALLYGNELIPSNTICDIDNTSSIITG